MILKEEIFFIIVRAIISILTLLIATKLLGKKQISQLTIFDYIIGITIGSIVADSIITLDESIIYGITAVIAISIIGCILSYLSIKNHTINYLLNGKPITLLENGEFIYKNLKKSKITLNKFIEQSRLKGYFDINVLSSAILETDGQISFLPKEEYQNSNTSDFKPEIKTNLPKQTVCKPIIIEGKIISETLNECKINQDWLINELKKLKITRNEEILLATIDENKKIKVYKR